MPTNLMSTNQKVARFQTIVLPYDGSELSEQVFSFLPRICPPVKTQLHLVGVFQPWNYGMGVLEPIPHSTLDALRQSWGQLLAGAQNRLEQVGYQVETHLREGDVANEILAVAQTVQADLIAMSTHGRSGFTAFALGSVTERVLQATQLPLLLVRQKPPVLDTPIHTLLVPLDGSELSEQVLPVTRRLMGEGTVRVILLRVIQDLDKTNRQILFRDDAQAETAMKHWLGLSTNYLDDLAQRTFGKQADVQTLALRGDPDQTICSTADEVRADLIVMSTHGHTGLSRWLYGSVANKVLRSTNCPILLVRSVTPEL